MFSSRHLWPLLGVIIPAILTPLCTTPASADTVAVITGIASVEDGDGILFGDVEIRLQGIAAPELGDPFGYESYLGLNALASGKEVRCELDGSTAGRSRRPVGICFLDGLDVGLAQVQAGLARDCPSFSKGRYRDAEKEAKDAGNDLSSVYDLPKYC